MNGLLNILTSLAFSISLIFVMPSGQARAQNAAPTLVVSPTTVAPGGLITVSWQAPSTHSNRDWIGLFLADMPSAGTTKIASTYVPSGTSGTLTFTAPTTPIPQTYQLRYLLNDGYQEVVRSATITVTSAINSTPQPTTSSTAPSAPTTYSVNASQITVAPGAALTVTWQAPSTHSSKDWIGLFLANMPSAGNTIISYKYVPSGTGGVLTFTAPTTPFPQTYQLRYLVNDGYTEKARSAAITVSSAGISTTPSAPSPAPTPTPAPSPTTTSPSSTPSAPSPAPTSTPAPSPTTTSPSSEACPNGKQIAFPGAEGFGRCTQGGRGGRAIEVTNLNDSGPGSLRQCAQVESGPRSCVFRIAGTIVLSSLQDIEIVNPYVTINGLTAPGGGIALKGAGITVKANQVIVRYLRVRPGVERMANLGQNANGITLMSNQGVVISDVIIDHCSVSWGTDDLINIVFGTDNVTVQWSILSEGLNCSLPGCGSRGFLMGYSARRVSFHHNLSAHNFIRWPEVTGGGDKPDFTGQLDFVNNVHYNGNGTDTIVDPWHGPIYSNFVGNFWKDGPSAYPQNLGHAAIRAMGQLPYSGQAALYVRGNIGRGRMADGLPDTNIIYADNGGLPVQAARYPYPLVTTTDAFTARDQVLAKAGAVLPARDSVDQRIVNDVTNGTGKWISDPSDVGGWPVLASGTAPVDTDHDGMPDTWELAHGLDPANAADGPQDANGDGYTNLEEFLNSPTTNASP